MPPRSAEALRLAKRYYGFDHPPEADLPAEVMGVNELVRSSEDFDHLEYTVRKKESLAEKIGMVEAYLEHVVVPLYKREAEDLLQRLRQEAASKP